MASQPESPTPNRRVLTYEVGVFDTLNSIALKFGMNSAEVMRLNKLRSSNVYSGQQLQVFEPPLRTSRSKSTDAIKTTSPAGSPSSIVSSLQAKRTASAGFTPEQQSPSPASAPNTNSNDSSSQRRDRRPSKSMADRIAANAALTPTRQHRVIAAPLLVSLRQQRERKYFFENDDFDLLSPTSHRLSRPLFVSSPRVTQALTTPSGGIQPLPQSKGFLANIPDELKINQRDILKESARYFVSEQRNILGELTLTPSTFFFEPELDDPLTKQLGLLKAQFQCDLQNIVAVHVVEAADVLAGWHAKLPSVEGFPSMTPNGSTDSLPELDTTGLDADNANKPRFLQLSVMSNSGDVLPDTGKIIWFLINRAGAEMFYKRIRQLLAAGRGGTMKKKVKKTIKLPRAPAKVSPSASPESRTSIEVTRPVPIIKAPPPSRTSLDGPAPSKLSASAPPSTTIPVEDIDTTIEEGFEEIEVEEDDLGFIGPTLKDTSVILQTVEIQQKMALTLPTRFRNCEWTLLYSTERHGISLNTFYNRTRGKGPTLMLIEDEDGFVFGGFASESWESRKGFYGTGESLLFTLFPTHNVYPWSGLNDYFMFSRDDQIAMGSGGGKFGFWLDSDFYQGTSAPCDTFLNTCLAGQEFFKCTVMECWGFEGAADF